jgi:phosphoribosylformylglycinamidine cyclo-ligase
MFYVLGNGRLLAAHVDIRGLAHITGGGLIDNPPRIFPDGLGARLQRGSWPELPIFSLIQQLGEIDSQEMFHVFNMGLGMLMVVPAVDVPLGLINATRLNTAAAWCI